MNTILIVEDERIVGLDIKSSLEIMGYNVLDMVSNGKDAIARAEALRPDIILMDIGLQGDMTGIESARIIKSTYNVPIIFATAYEDSKTYNEALEINPDGYIVKPFYEEKLKEYIERALLKDKNEKSG